MAVASEQDAANYSAWTMEDCGDGDNVEGFDPYCNDGPEMTWADYLAVSDYKLLTETVRMRRLQRKECKFKSDQYKQHGADLYDLQVALKKRFKIDICNVK